MWILAHLKSVPSPSPADRNSVHRRTRGGFTLIELLVVVAILALLMSILLPSLSCAREAARKVVCGTTLNGFGKSLMLYMTDNDDWIPGVNTSAVALRAKQYSAGAGGENIKKPELPVQSFDWISPLIKYSDTELPASRAERWENIWQKRWACPSRFNVKSTLHGSAPDMADFQKINWKACSYLMSTWFSCWGKDANRRIGRMELFNTPLPIIRPGTTWEVDSLDYISRIDRVGPAGRKVFAADGMRYLPSGDAPLDHDVSPFSFTFGAFTSSGAWWYGSTAYGPKNSTQTYGGQSVSWGSSGNTEGKNLPLSYRHGCGSPGSGAAQDNRGTINAVYFDGHVETLGDRASREIHLWYPSGSVVTKTEGMTSSNVGDIIP
ncbi:MAG: type II secretion system protein [Phycisphaerae bacterium]|nr:type II secretion system protein [Phycisphaerae bacterium]